MTANTINPQTRSPTRTRLTLGFVVVLGVCVVLAAVVALSSWWVRRDLKLITQVELQRVDAAMEMEINTLGTGLAVAQYLHDHQDDCRLEESRDGGIAASLRAEVQARHPSPIPNASRQCP